MRKLRQEAKENEINILREEKSASGKKRMPE